MKDEIDDDEGLWREANDEDDEEDEGDFAEVGRLMTVRMRLADALPVVKVETEAEDDKDDDVAGFFGETDRDRDVDFEDDGDE